MWNGAVDPPNTFTDLMLESEVTKNVSVPWKFVLLNADHAGNLLLSAKHSNVADSVNSD